MDLVSAILIAINIFHCHGASLKEQLEHIATKRLENLGYNNVLPVAPGFRRLFSFNPGESSVILGAPSIPSHLPEAEPILPGHTLIRPALGMLKSAVKFPHKDWENGAGVYGNINSLGITYGGTNERVLYTGFRRLGDNMDPLGSSLEPNSLVLVLIPRSENNEEDYSSTLLARAGKKARRKKKKRKSKNTLLKLTNMESVPTNESIRIMNISKDTDFKLARKYGFVKDKNKKGGKKKRRKQKKKRYKKLQDGTGYKYNRNALNHQIFHLKGLDLPSFGYDGLSKRMLRRFDSTAEEHENDDSTDVEIHETNIQTTDNNPNPKQTWFMTSQDLYNHIKISQDAPEWTELMPAVPKDYDEKEWMFFPTAAIFPRQEFGVGSSLSVGKYFTRRVPAMININGSRY